MAPKQEIKELLGLYEQSAAAGDAIAMYKLGFFLANGHGGTKKDVPKGIEWFKKAAEKGNADAAYHLGIHLTDGDGVGKDKAAGIGWFAK
eukprot:gene8563-8867_t